MTSARARVTRALAARFGAPAVMTRYSRLLIDPNRGADDPTLVMRLSDGTLVPGNAGADAAEEIARRIERFHRPYHAAIDAALDRTLAQGIVPLVFSVTPSPRSGADVQQALARHRPVGQGPAGGAAADRAFPPGPGLIVGDNEPYDGCLEGDTLYQHATMRGLPHALIELRQDLVGSEAGASAGPPGWATRYGAAPRRSAVRRIKITARAPAPERPLRAPRLLTPPALIRHIPQGGSAAAAVGRRQRSAMTLSSTSSGFFRSALEARPGSRPA